MLLEFTALLLVSSRRFLLVRMYCLKAAQRGTRAATANFICLRTVLAIGAGGGTSRRAARWFR